MLRRLMRGRDAFCKTFEPEHGRKVLAHIRHFCGAGPAQSPFDANPFGMARMVGRLEVYKEIMRFLTLTDAQIDDAARRAAQTGGDNE